MAAHLVKQCTCLLREAARLAPAMAPVGQLRLARVAHKTLTSSATSPSSHFPSSMMKLVENENEKVFTLYPENHIDQLIKKATRPEELLELLDAGHHLNNNHAALIFIRLSRLLFEKPEDKASLIQDARFQQLRHLLNSQVGATVLSKSMGKRNTASNAGVHSSQSKHRQGPCMSDKKGVRTPAVTELALLGLLWKGGARALKPGFQLSVVTKRKALTKERVALNGNFEISSVWHGTLSRLLRSLYALGLPETSKELQSVEQEVRWRIRRLRYRHLALLAESCATLSRKQHSQELLAELLMHLERRWTEIEDGRTLVTIMMKVGHLSESLMNRLEDKVLSLKAGGTQPASPGPWACSLGDRHLQRGVLHALGSEPLELLSEASGFAWCRTRGLGAATDGCPVAAFIKHHSLLPTQACLELVEQFGPDELRKVLVTLAAQSRRSVPLLRAVSYHLVQKPFRLTKGVLLDLAYAYAKSCDLLCPEGKLNFHQTQVCQRLAADLLSLAPSLTSGEVARCAKSFALLKWLNLPLFEAFAQVSQG
ncbi:hypothetical protein P7K49_025001 [Saguinus oedipus]|uniref:FAST kinase domain-containing protein 4 n=1 Tax=Saguinus oedipus TaxID=9490 RepID=A0ABQ9UFV1_SAGOE|nr:hypothetical protein P7K49_025001 [Saguinus oedipus]